MKDSLGGSFKVLALGSALKDIGVFEMSKVSLKFGKENDGGVIGSISVEDNYDLAKFFRFNSKLIQIRYKVIACCFI